MRVTRFVTGASALALLIGLGLASPAQAGGLEDYLDDGEGYGADGPAATSDDWDKFYDQAPAEPAAAPAPAPTPIVEGPGLDDVSDAGLSAAPDTGCALPGDQDADQDENATRRAELNEIENGQSIDPCLIMADANINVNDTNGGGDNGGGGGGGGGGAGSAQSVLSVGALNPGSLFGGSTDNQADPNAEVDSLLQVNVGTPDRSSPDAEGPALIEANLFDGLLTGENGEPGALQVTVLDAINGDGQLLDTTSVGPLDALGGVLALGLEPGLSGFEDPENIDGLAEVNLGGNDPDGPLGFNAIQVSGPEDETGPLANAYIADGIDDGFDSVVDVYAGDDPYSGENSGVVGAVVDQPQLVELLNTIGVERVTVLDGSDTGGATPLGDVAYVEGGLGELLSPLGIGGANDNTNDNGTGLDLLLEPLGLDSTDPSNDRFASLANAEFLLVPLDSALGGALVGEGALGFLTGPLQGVLLPVSALLGGPTATTPGGNSFPN